MNDEITKLCEALRESVNWNIGLIKAANEMGLPGTDVTEVSRTVLKVLELLEKYEKV